MRKPWPLWMIFWLLIIGAACEEDDSGGDELSLNDRQQQINRLTRTWNADRASFEGFDVTEEFQGFTITFAEDNTWTATGNNLIFGSQGPWELDEEDINLLRLGGVEVQLTISPDVRLMQLSFVLAGESVGSRTEGLSGEYIIEFSTEPEED
ncbi:MAG: hypothetical protein AAF944_17095 [Bacteroidota bacterium]